MRLKLKLYSKEKVFIPINYQHFLSSIIYNFLAESNLNFSTQLHEGTHLKSPKKFKFFTFSWLQIQNKKIIKDQIQIASENFYWYISSPWEEFLYNFLNGLLKTTEIRIGNNNFQILQVETLKDFELLHSRVKFKCLSPITITTKKEYNGRLIKYYYKPSDNKYEISEKIRRNLINKYTAYFGKTPTDDKLFINFDENYLKSSKSQVLVHYIKEDMDIKIPAIMCPFEVEGSKELIKFGYECGFGELNSAGFGMVEDFK